MRLLLDPEECGAPAVDAPALSALPRHPEFKVAVEDSAEPLITFPPEIRQEPYYYRAGWPGSVATLLARASVVSKLVAAMTRLPTDFEIVVIDAWRSAELQTALFKRYYSSSSDQKLPAGFVSDPKNPLWLPPHETGGALDVSLTWRNCPLALGTPFDSFTPEARVDAYEHRRNNEPVRSLRRLLYGAMIGADFCPYPEEWWHFSYGDQHWAFNRGLSVAPFGRIPRQEMT